MITDLSVSLYILGILSVLQHEPSKIIDIEFRHPKQQQEDPDYYHGREEKKVPEPSDGEQLAFLTTLQKLTPDAAVLDSCFSSSSNRSVKRIRSLPPTISSLYKAHYKSLEAEELAIECQRVFDEELTMTHSESHYLFKSTTLQCLDFYMA